MTIQLIKELLAITGIIAGAVGAVCVAFYTFNSTRRKAEYLAVTMASLEKRLAVAQSDISLLKYVDKSLKESMREIKQDLKDIKDMLIRGVKCS